ncbi:MAG: N-acetylneuraminate synthase, partial [Cyclobacteriaceae bacterium]|nr:N-acetylneuraminate synthase [Cyclobacteriaceae bacterium]
SMFPGVTLGLSDHTPGHVTVLGAVALGARVVEKHFTDDRTRKGPDHAFSLDPKLWRGMVDEVAHFRATLGDGEKKIEQNEMETAVLQRRGLRYRKSLSRGHQIEKEDLIALRPCPLDSIPPYKIPEVIGKTLQTDVEEDEAVRQHHLAT